MGRNKANWGSYGFQFEEEGKKRGRKGGKKFQGVKLASVVARFDIMGKAASYLPSHPTVRDEEALHKLYGPTLFP
jgi:hypothetical protein